MAETKAAQLLADVKAHANANLMVLHDDDALKARVAAFVVHAEAYHRANNKNAPWLAPRPTNKRGRAAFESVGASAVSVPSGAPRTRAAVARARKVGRKTGSPSKWKNNTTPWDGTSAGTSTSMTTRRAKRAFRL